MKVLQGSVVKSIAGHDKNSYYVAVRTEKDYVYIADGKERKLEKPKRKNMKHISVTAAVLDLNGITNKQLKRLLREFDNQVNNIPENYQNSNS